MTDAEFQAALLELDLLEHKGVTPEIKTLIDQLKQTVSGILTSTNLTPSMKQLRLQVTQRSLMFLKDNDAELAKIQVDMLSDFLY